MNASPRWSQTTKQLISATFLILAGLLLYSFRTILAPLVIAFLGSYIFAPVVGWLSRHLHVGRGWAVALLYLIGLGILAMAPAFTVPAVLDEVEDLWANMGVIINKAIAWLAESHEVPFLGYVITLPEIEIPTFAMELDKVIDLLGGTISPIAGGAFAVLKTVASGVGWLIFIAVLSFYLLMDAERIGPALVSLVPHPYRDETSKLLVQIDNTWSAFLRGQIVLCLIIGVLTAVAMGAVGLRFSIALGVVAGILELIPSFGPFLAAIPAVLLALFQGVSYLPTSNLGAAIIVAIIYLFIQSIENNFLVPRIIGSSLNLPPLVVIIGVLGGATTGGILGALLAAPSLATLRDVILYVYSKLADLDPFPEPLSFASRVRTRDVRAILFDLDGTLLDTDDMLVERMATRLQPVAFLDRLYDSKRLARRFVMAVEGPFNFMMTLTDAIRLDNKFLSFGEWLRRVYGQRDPAHYVAVDGVVQFIQESSQAYDLAIITTRNRRDTIRFVEEFGLQDCFKALVTRQDVKRLKPHPEPIVRAARQLGYSPEQCIVVGDTTVDIRAGKRARALTVGVLCGFGERPELERLDPDLIVGTTMQLAEHLPREEKA